MHIEFHMIDFILVAPAMALFLASCIPLLIKVLRGNQEQNSFATLIYAYLGIVIAGGFDRQLPIEHFAASLNRHATDIRQLFLIGQSAARLAAACDATGYSDYEILTEQTMSTIVTAAQNAANSGDAVLLSPGFASFDMFKNFEDRGDQYRRAVERI